MLVAAVIVNQRTRGPWVIVFPPSFPYGTAEIMVFLAGLARMPLRTYTAYNVLGAVLWIWSMLFIGYFLGSWGPGVEKQTEKLILVVIFIQLLPALISWQRWLSRSAAA